MPKIAIGVVTILFGINIGTNLYTQIWTASGADKLVTFMQRQVDNGEEVIERANTELAEVSQELRELKDQQAKARETAERALQGALDSHLLSDRILALVTLGRHHLLFQQNAKQARSYAREAEKLLKDKLAEYGHDSPLGKSLDGLWLPVMILIGDSGIGDDDIQCVKDAANKLLERNCNCIEGNYFRAVELLDGAIFDATNPSPKIPACVDAFRNSIPAEQHGHPSALLLACALLKARKPELSVKTCQTFLEQYPNQQRGRLNNLTRTRIDVVERLLALSIHSTGRTPDAEKDHCGRSLEWFLPAAEARILEQVVDEIHRDCTNLPVSDEHRSNVSQLASNFLDELRELTCPAPASATTAPNEAAPGPAPARQPRQPAPTGEATEAEQQPSPSSS